MSLRPRPGIMAVEPYVGGESKVAGQNRVIKLSSNEGAFGTPPMAEAAIRDTAAEDFRYPDGGALELRQAIGKRFGLDPARIVCGAGSDELIGLLISSYGGPGTELLVSEYAFSMYAIYGQVAGCSVVVAPERNRTIDVDAMLARVSPATRLVFIANPNNPTGTLLPQAEVERLRRGLPDNVLLALDAAYAEYVEDPAYEPGDALVDAGDNTVMLRTFSKIFGLGGARVGWCYGPAPVIDVLNRVRSPFNVNLLGQRAAIGALAEPGWVEKGRTHNTTARAGADGKAAWGGDRRRREPLQLRAGRFRVCGAGRCGARGAQGTRHHRAADGQLRVGAVHPDHRRHGRGVRPGRGRSRSRNRQCLNRCSSGSRSSVWV